MEIRSYLVWLLPGGNLDAKKIQEFYLHALYTEAPISNFISEEEHFFLQHHLSERLNIERAARLRNLRTVLHDDMHLLNRIFSRADLLPMVQNYAASPYFWMHRGRSLIEDFCLFVFQSYNIDPLLKLVARIEGVHSGLSASIVLNTPWPEHQIEDQGKDILESFLTPFYIVWDKFFQNKNDYFPVQERAICKIIRSDEKIKIKFQREELCKQLA